MSLAEENYVTWSEGEYYFYMILSLFNAILFIALLINMSFLPSKYQTSLRKNKYAYLVWISIILTSIIDVFINSTLITNFDDNCHENNCIRCAIGGNVKQVLVITFIVSRLLVMLRIIEINYQPFPQLAYPKCIITGFKIFLLLLFIFTEVISLAVVRMEFRVYPLKSNFNLQICDEIKDNETIQARNKMIGVVGVLFMLSQLILCALFVKKAWSLYNATKQRIANKANTKQGLIMLSCVIKPIIRHSVLVITITLANLLQIMVTTVNPNGMNTLPIGNLIIGLAIICMFPFGRGYFRCFCYCIDKPLARKWIQSEYASLKKLSSTTSAIGTSADKVKQSVVNDESIPLEVESLNESNKKIEVKSNMESIPESQRVDVFTQTVLPSLGWSLFPPIETSVVVSDSERVSFAPESVTDFEKLDAISNFDL